MVFVLLTLTELLEQVPGVWDTYCPFPGLPVRHSSTRGTWTDKPVPLTQVMTTPVSAQPGKGGFPKRFWSQSQESVFAPIPCGVPFEPRPGVRCNPGGNRLLAGEQDPRGGGGGLPLAGGGVRTTLRPILSGNL